MSWLWDSLRLGLEELANRQIIPPEFYFEFMSNAVIAAIMIGPLLGVLGTMVVVKRMAFFSQAVGNAALTGVAIGVLLGESLSTPYVSMFSFCLLFGIVLKYTQQRTSLSNDVLIGVFLSVSLAVGASLMLFVSARLNTHVLEAILFGSILTVNHTDLTILLAVTVICALVIVPLYNEMLLGSFSSSLAQARGVSVKAMDYTFVVLITLVTVACVKIIGAVLVEALLVIPAAAARNISGSIRQFVVYSVIFATVSCIAGIVIPMQYELAIPSGGAIIMVAALIFVVTAVLRNALGVFRAQEPA